MRHRGGSLCPLLFLFFVFSSALQSDELLHEAQEFGLEGGRSPDFEHRAPPRRRVDLDTSSSSVQFSLNHAFGESDFSPAGTFTARLKTWNHGGQTLTKLRFSRNTLTEMEREAFERLLEEDAYYTIKVTSNVLTPHGRDYIISSVRARCLSQESLNEHFIIHMDGVNILAVNYGSSRACQYPRLLKLPEKWSFNSYTVLKNSEQAPKTPTFAEEVLAGENEEGEGVKPLEKSFWAKYWMYLIPLGLIIVNSVTQAMNMPQGQPAGQSAS